MVDPASIEKMGFSYLNFSPSKLECTIYQLRQYLICHLNTTIYMVVCQQQIQHIVDVHFKDSHPLLVLFDN